MQGIQKGLLFFLKKFYIQKGRGLDLGAEPPRIRLWLVPPEFRPPPPRGAPPHLT